MKNQEKRRGPVPKPKAEDVHTWAIHAFPDWLQQKMKSRAALAGLSLREFAIQVCEQAVRE